MDEMTGGRSGLPPSVSSPATLSFALDMVGLDVYRPASLPRYRRNVGFGM